MDLWEYQSNLEKPFYRKPRNIVRIIFFLIWLGNLIIMILKFEGYTLLSILTDFTVFYVLFYILTVSAYLAEFKYSNSYKNTLEMIITRFLVIGASIAVFYMSFHYYKAIVRDIYVDKVQRKEVYITKKYTTTRGGRRVYISGYPESYRVYYGNTDLEAYSTYVVEMLPNTKVIIGIEKKK